LRNVSQGMAVGCVTPMERDRHMDVASAYRVFEGKI
jgi:hypothetical protein